MCYEIYHGMKESMITTNFSLKPLSYRSVKKLTPLTAKSLLHLLDFDVYVRIPSYRSTGCKRLSDKWLISVHNFPELAYLNLAEIWYSLPTYLYHAHGDNLVNEQERLLKYFLKLVAYQLLIYLEARLEIHPTSSIVFRMILYACRISLPRLPAFVGIHMFEFLLGILYKYHNDSYLVIDLLMTFCDIGTIQAYFQFGLLKLSCIEYVFEKCCNVKFNLQQYLIKTVNEPFDRHVVPFCPVLQAIFQGRKSLLALCYKYGFQREEPNIKLRNIMYMKYLGYINTLQSSRIINPRNPEQIHRYGIHRQYLLLEILNILYRFTMDTYGNRLQWLQCGYLIFRSIPDPLISLNELRNFWPERDGSSVTLTRICSAFESHFPEIVAEKYEPRTLAHLCRCAVRSSLRNNFQLSKGINKLVLPPIINSYLQLLS